jgi:hypothetical protein
MKKALLLFAIFLFTISIKAQVVTTATPSAPTSATSPVNAPPQSVTNSPNTVEGAANAEKNDSLPIAPSNNSPFNLPPEKKRPVKVPQFDAPPTIDGKLDEAMWQQAAVFKDFWQTSPGDNIAPSKKTIAYMGYDERHLYIAFHCFDEPDKIRATVAKRDGIFGEDNVRLWLDTYNDQRRAYIIGFNPLGIQQDGIYTENQGEDYSVDIVMESKGVIVSDGWTLEVKIPFKSLRYAAGKDKFWGIQIARNIDRFNDEIDSWMPQSRNITGLLIQAGKITGLENIKTERTLEIVPSITLSETGNRKRTLPISTVNRFGAFNPQFNPAGIIDAGKFTNDSVKHDIGVNFKFNITPNITLDATYNPDFAEIEADAAVVTANQRFPIFFQEKRPFFLEGIDTFQSPLQVFYSRTIIDPDYAAKLTGKIGKTSFGFLAASDKAPGNYSEDERNDPDPNFQRRISEFLDKNAYFAVVRLKRDVGKENSIGFFGTTRVFPEQRNFLGGFDGRFKLNPKTIFSFQAVGTNSRRCFFEPGFDPSLNPAQRDRNRAICGGSTFNNYRNGNGLAYFANYDFTEKNRGFVFEVGGRSRDYRADAGFTRRTNTNYAFAGFRLSTEPNPKGKIIRAHWRNNFSLNYDWEGRSQEAEWGSNFSLNLRRNTNVTFSGGFGYERLFEEEFGLKRLPSRPNGGAFYGDSERSSGQGWTSVSFNSSPNKKISFNVFGGTIFNAFDFDFGAGCRPAGSGCRFQRVSSAALAGFDNLDPGTGQQYDFGAGVELRPTNPLRVSLSYNKSQLIRHDTDRTAFDSNIFTFRSTYQFTRFTFVRTRWDYDSISSNVRGQMLLGWNPNPGTAFYVGYNDNFNYNGFNPFTGQLEPRFERNSRTFFIRASYLFRKSF